MAARRTIALVGALITISSCSHTPASSAPAPGTAPTASGQPGTPVATGPARRLPPSRDSVAKLRAAYVTQVMASIAGRENQPATQVFKNVQVLTSLTAGELVHKMDAEYGAAMSWNCVNCHRFAPQGNFASDTSTDKRRARFMQQMTDDINKTELPKLYPRDTPKVSCMTCHRGYNEPPSADYLIPERGKPGGLPLSPARGASGPPQPAGTPPRPPM
jgi:hypothetical protein